MKNFIKKYRVYIISFILPIILFLFVLACRKIIFSDHSLSIFISDMKAQYISLFSYLKNFNFDNFIYSFSNGLGGSMVGTFFYYLASPLNFIVFLFEQSNLQIAVIAILIAKFALSSLTMTIYLKNHFSKLSSPLIIMLAICYSFMMYSVGYYFNIMWLDSIYLLPLLFLGIDKIVKNKKPTLYAITLFMAIVSNYYMGFILCIGSCLYFLYSIVMNYKWEDKKKILKPIIRFIIISLLVGLATSFILIPSILEITESSKTNALIANFPPSLVNIFPGIFGRMFIGSNNVGSILNKTTPYIYCGLIVSVLVVLYFLNKKISKKEKIVFASVIAFFLLSFSFNYFNMVFHGFTSPACFNFRYSFILCFFLIVISAKSLLNIKHLKPWNYYITALVLTIPASFILMHPYSYNEMYKIFISLLLIYFYLFFIYAHNNYKNHPDHKLLTYLVCGLSCLELAFNMYLCMNNLFTVENIEYKDTVNIVQPKIDNIKKKDSSFYRFEKNFSFSNNDSLLLDYNGGNAFLSTLSGKSINFFKSSGLSGIMSSHSYKGNEYEILNSILGFKYLMYKDETNSHYKLLDSFKYSLYSNEIMYNYEMVDVNTYENPYSLNLGFMVNKEVLNFQRYFIMGRDINKLEYQNSIVNTMTNKEIYPFTQSNITKIDDKTYEFTVTSDDDLYFGIGLEYSDDFNSLTVMFNDDYSTTYNINSPDAKKINKKYKIGDKIKVKLISDRDIKLLWEPMIYHFNYDKFEEFYNSLKNNQMEIIEQKGNYIKGQVLVTDNNVLFTSIPYHDYFDVYVDGKKAEKKLIFDAFIGLELDKGKHTIEFKYTPKSLILGSYISIASLSLLSVYLICEKKLLKKLD